MEKLRSMTPTGDHCSFLRQDPEACLSFPLEIEPTEYSQGVAKGDPCPNNPFTVPHTQELLETLNEYSDILDVAVEIIEDMNSNLLPTYDVLTPEEVAIAKAAKRYLQEARAEAAEKAALEARQKSGGGKQT